MKVIRFVTDAEKELYLSGAKIINDNPHSGSFTTSVGSCFAELTPERDADKWLRKLFGIRPCEWCIEFDTETFAKPLTPSVAKYSADNIEDMEAGKTIPVREWCATTYSLRTHPYTRIGRCPSIEGLIMGERIVWQ